MRNASFNRGYGRSLSFAIVCVFIFCCQLVHAQKESYTQKLNGFLKAGDSCMVVDDKYALLDTKDWGRIKNIKVEDLVSFQLRFDTLAKIPNKPFKVEVLVDVYYWNADRKQDKPNEKKNVSLRIEYDTAKGKAFKSFDAYAFKDAYKVAVVIRKIKGDLFKDSLPPFFQLANEINILRKYEFDPSVPLSVHAQVLQGKSIGDIAPNAVSKIAIGGSPSSESILAISNCQQPASILSLSWSSGSFAQEFDLEYTFIDFKSEVGQMIFAGATITDPFMEQLFVNNSTRVTIKPAVTTTNYKVNLVYDKGYFFYRIRPVTNDIPNLSEPEFTIRNERAWVYTDPVNTSIKYMQFVDDDVAATYKPHEPCINWQYNASFAEDAKNKEILTYFDGKLQNRQTVTISHQKKDAGDTREDVAVVQETVLDEFGRAAASILPAPANNNQFQYFRKFNVNTASEPKPYSYNDILYGSNCSLVAGPLSNSAGSWIGGAAGYYSTNNVFKGMVVSGTKLYPEHDFVPDAQNYPISVTEYMPDQTGRIKRQGGVGPNFQIGQKDTKYFYGKPNQDELDRLFGSEVGDASRYLKNMVMDPNGQISVSYVNSSGKTIATALAGGVTPNLDALASYPANPTAKTSKLLKPTDFSYDASNNIILGTSTFLAPATGTYTIGYDLQNLQHIVYFGANLAQQLCYTCYYDVEITVRNNCNKSLLPSTGEHIVDGVFTVPAGTPPFTKVCVGSTPTVLLHGSLAAIIGQDDLGECYVTYTLKPSKKAEDYYVQEHWKDNTDLLRFQDFLLKYFDQAAFEDCYTDCDACKELGEKENFVDKLLPYIKDLVDSKGNVDIVVNDDAIRGYLGNLYENLKKKCDIILEANQCHGGPCEERLNMMMLDVSPGGQYALYDSLTYNLVQENVNVLVHYAERPPTASDFPSTGPIYKDENGNQDYVQNDFGQIVKPEELSLREFIQKFRPSWARTLAYWHPEYCYYRWCLINSRSREFDRKIKEDMDGIKAFDQGYMEYGNPSALLDKDPFFTTIDGLVGKGSCYYNAMKWELDHYSRTKVFTSHNEKDILQFIDFTLYCKDQDFNNTCSVDENCRKKNREWELYVAIYLDLKQKYDEMARRCWQPTCINCYIGTDGLPTAQIPAECSAQPDIEWQALIPSCACSTELPLDSIPHHTPILVGGDPSCPCSGGSFTYSVSGGYPTFYILPLGTACESNITIYYSSSIGGIMNSVVIEHGHTSATGTVWIGSESNLLINSAICALTSAVDLRMQLPIKNKKDAVVTVNEKLGVKKNIQKDKNDKSALAKPSVGLRIKDTVINGKKVRFAENSSIIIEPGKKYTFKDLLGGSSLRAKKAQSNASARTESFCDGIESCLSYYASPEHNSGYNNCSTIVLDLGCASLPPGGNVTVSWESCPGDPFYVQSGSVFLSATNPSAVVCGLCYTIAFTSISCGGDEEPPASGYTCLLSQCNDDPRRNDYQNKVRVYPDYISPCTIAKMSCLTGSETTVNSTNVKALLAIHDNCVAAADNLIQELQNRGCLDPSIDLIALKSELVTVCEAGGAASNPVGSNGIIQLQNPYGASSDPSSNSWDAILSSHGIDIPAGCSSDLVGLPYPYDKANFMVVKPLIRESNQQICDQLTWFKERYNDKYSHYPSDHELYDFLKELLGTDFQLTLDELTELLSVCFAKCPTMLLDHDLLLPAALSKDGACKTCSEINDAVNAFNTKFASLSAIDPQYEALFKNFMNHYFGYGLSYADYYEFMQRCKNKEENIILCDKAATTDHPIEEYSCIKDKIDNSFILAQQAFWQYKDSVDNAFHIAYRTRCRFAKPSMTITVPFQEYHYTLYYYDQAGNLVKTVPPQGVVPLSDVQIAQVVDARDNPMTDNCVKLNQSEYMSFRGNQYLKDEFTLEYRIKPLALPTNQIRLWASISNREILDGSNSYKENAQLFYKHSTHEYQLKYATIAPDGITYQEYTFAFGSTGTPTPALTIDQWAHLSVAHTPGAANEFVLYINGRPFGSTSITSLYATHTYTTGVLSLSAYDFTVLQDYIGTSQVLCRNLRIFTRVLPQFETQFNAEQPLQLYDYTGLIHNLKLNDGQGINPVNEASANQGLLSASTLWVLDESFIGTTHQFITSYAYNSLNQVAKQNTPDGGTSEFWYDRLGRLSISQNAEQKASSTSDISNRYSYTNYDDLGRIVQVGERINSTATVNEENARNEDWLLGTWPTSGTGGGSNRQITITRYSNPATVDGNVLLLPTAITSVQDNLRNRVAATFFKANQGDGEQQFASYYTYDISGNVKTLWQQLVAMKAYDGTGIKKIDYDYDLISGKVNHVWYQKEKRDQYYYLYHYDADNRLIEAYSGRSDNASTLLKLDASYRYYLHGPLARTELGADNNKLQGLDYAYTLQGWLKGVNGTFLDAAKDMGKDGNTTGPHQNFGRDVYSFGLNYYASDYAAVAGSTISNGTFLPYTFRTKTDPVGRPLYNGNIAAISLALYKLDNGQTTGYSYGYDQLNRLVNMRKHNNDISAGGTATAWTYLDGPDPGPLTTNKYGEKYSYDANGNIMSLQRNGAGTATSSTEMDDMKYSYYYKRTDGSWGEYSNDMLILGSDVQYMTNRLYRVRDNVASNRYTTDIDDQATVNYQYDNIGNMISDAAEGVTSIKWTVYGKIQSVTKVKNGVTTIMSYYYDVTGNRVMKKVNNKITFYIRDAQGNVMSVYDAQEPEELTTIDAPPIGYTWAEQHLYGSSRLGMYTPRDFIADINVESPTGPDLQGKRTYELSNHLGNVHVTIADIKREVITGSTSYFIPEILTTSDYYPFGMLMPERHGYKVDGGWASGSDNVNGNNVPQQLTIDHRDGDHPAEYKASSFVDLVTGFASGSGDTFLAYIANGSNTTAGNTGGSGGEYNVYRYGFNGQERDDEIEGVGNINTAEFWEYDCRSGRRWNVEPLIGKYPSLSSYVSLGDNPVNTHDPDGKDVIYVNGYRFAGSILATDRDWKYQKKLKETYWNSVNKSFTYAVDNYFNDYNEHYVTGDHAYGSKAKTRIAEGKEVGIAMVTSGEIKVSKENNIMTIVMHSQGNAEGVGIALGIIEESKKKGIDITVNLVFLSVHQPNDINKEMTAQLKQHGIQFTYANDNMGVLQPMAKQKGSEAGLTGVADANAENKKNEKDGKEKDGKAAHSATVDDPKAFEAIKKLDQEKKIFVKKPKGTN